MRDYWFKPKTYGYGATPANWKGWLAVILTVAVTAAATIALIVSPQSNGTQPSFSQVLLWAVIVATAVGALVWLSRTKTEGDWKWRWGNKSEDDPR